MTRQTNEDEHNGEMQRAAHVVCSFRGYARTIKEERRRAYTCASDNTRGRGRHGPLAPRYSIYMSAEFEFPAKISVRTFFFKIFLHYIQREGITKKLSKSFSQSSRCTDKAREGELFASHIYKNRLRQHRSAPRRQYNRERGRKGWQYNIRRKGEVAGLYSRRSSEIDSNYIGIYTRRNLARGIYM